MAVVAVKSGYVMNQGLPLNYLEWGEPDAPAMVLAGAFRNSSYEWRDIAERLQDQYRVIGINLRGQGDSASFPVREFNPDFYVEDLKTFVEELELAPAVILGFSVVISGTAVAFASAYPNLVRGIILVDGGLGYSKEQADAAGMRVRSMPNSFPSWEAALSYFGEMSDQVFAARSVIEERAPYMFRRLPDGTVTWKHDPLLRELWPGDDFARNTGAHPTEVWERVQCPILVVKGMSANTTLQGHEHLTVEGCKQIVKYGKGSSWSAVPDVTSHFVYDENPNGFVGVIRPFIEKVCSV